MELESSKKPASNTGHLMGAIESALMFWLHTYGLSVKGWSSAVVAYITCGHTLAKQCTECSRRRRGEGGGAIDQRRAGASGGGTKRSFCAFILRHKQPQRHRRKAVDA